MDVLYYCIFFVGKPINIFDEHEKIFTLYDPRLLITHGNDASRPTVTVTFGIGSTNLGPFLSPSVVTVM